MDDNEAVAILDVALHRLFLRSDVSGLAEMYLKAQDPGIRERIEKALNGAIPRSTPHNLLWPKAIDYPVIYLIGIGGLPESTYMAVAKELGSIPLIKELLKLREKSSSVKVKEACDEAMIGVIRYLEQEGERKAVALAEFGGGKALPVNVEKERDAALIRVIQKWAEEAKDENILKLSEVKGISHAVKDAAAAALSRLGNIPDMHFKEAISVLATCGKLDALSDAYAEATLPRTKEQIGAVMDLAMQVAASLGWGDDGYNGSMVSCPCWFGRGPFEHLLTTDCPEPLKQKARKILEEGGSYGDPLGLGKKASENLHLADSCLRRVKLYLIQERHRNRGQILEGATVAPPERGTSTPAGRRIPHMRHSR
ncbi:MAG: hypothetical protein PHQ80_02805 [Candidatus ainarchaeum sp.]|nr:hypothetical protein [Candidatus ainarchaeum sp.]MDD5096417.1 hypothetical protein [Candidatus ainarchaeum sp.]